MGGTRQVSSLRVVVDREALLKLLRYRKGTTTADRRTEKLLDETIREGYSLLETAAVYRNVGLEVRGDAGVSVDAGELSLEGASIARHLADCTRGTIMAVTVGEGISARARELSEAGDMAMAAILDAFGSEAVEGLADMLTAHIAAGARMADCSLTGRFSPGYGDLSLEHQKGLLEYVEGSRVGISLSETLTMTPEKSITAVLGWRGKR